jgi:hypothetical protein
MADELPQLPEFLKMPATSLNSTPNDDVSKNHQSGEEGK